VTPEPGRGLPILIVGSYPPIRTGGAAAALDASRAAIASGDDPIVASPRSSAALYEVPVTGPFAGRRLDNLRRLTGASRLVLCAEQDLPVPTHFAYGALLPAVQRATLEGLGRAASAFDHVTLVIAADLKLTARSEAALRGLATEVIDARDRYRAAGEPGVTVLGPDDQTAGEQAADLARKLSRRALAPLPGPVRNRVEQIARRARAKLHRPG
jgi:hypothetical protein